MGYYTTYRLSALRENFLLDDKEFKSIVEKLQEISRYYFDEVHDGEATLYDAKWYDHDVDMATLSMLFPNTRFDVYGVGEEEDDEWEITYINGRSHSRQADWDTGDIDEFDPTFLQPCRQLKVQFLSCLIPDMNADRLLEQITDIL